MKKRRCYITGDIVKVRGRKRGREKVGGKERRKKGMNAERTKERKDRRRRRKMEREKIE